MVTSGAARVVQEVTLADVRRAAPDKLHKILDGFYQGFLEVVVFTSVWISAALASLTLFTAHVLVLPFNLQPFLLVLFSGLFIYILDHVSDRHVEGIPDGYAEVFFQRPAILILLVASAIATGVTVSMAPEAAKWAFGFYVSVGLLYGLPVLPVKSKDGWRAFRLKEIPGVKAWLVAIAITVAGFLLPVAWAGTGLTTEAWHLALFIFVFAASGCHMFDVRDIDSDREAGVVSLPIQAGVRRTKQALIAMNLVMLAVMMWGWIDGVTGPHPEIILCTIGMVIFIRVLDEETPRDVYSILLDGIYFLPALMGIAHEFLAPYWTF